MPRQNGSSQRVLRISPKAYAIWTMVQEKREARGLPPIVCDKRIEIKNSDGRKRASKREPEESPFEAYEAHEPGMPEFLLEEPYTDGIMRTRKCK